jgi:dUTP pyrophosphatase
MQNYDGYSPPIPIFRFALVEGLSDQFLPTKGSERATGWDVRSTEDLIIKPGEYVKIPLGFRMLAPPGWWLELRPRSSAFAKKHLHALYGVIDEDYEGHCVFAAQYNPYIELGMLSFVNGRCAVVYDESMHKTLEIKAGDAIGQLVPVQRQEMKVERISNEEIEKEYKERNTSRGTGGFGSTG